MISKMIFGLKELFDPPQKVVSKPDGTADNPCVKNLSTMSSLIKFVR